MFVNYIENNIYNPDVIIYDWDFPGVDEDEVRGILMRILEENYALVGIYTAIDKVDEIKQLINSPQFLEYNKRLFVLKKDTGIEKTILQKISDSEKDFSFKFGKKLRKNAVVSAVCISGLSGQALADQPLAGVISSL